MNGNFNSFHHYCLVVNHHLGRICGLNVFTDRSPAVLLSLCRLLGCAASAPNLNCRKWAELALHRYEGVSDSDLLPLYVPIMQICIKQGLNREDLEQRLLNLSKTGFVVNKKYSLLLEVDTLEKKVLNLSK
ncbi:hypothetical protein HHI36_003784 [Cryptolaemus montrouzieri]|uniref:Uncharacterized protein n=1 Tax=Cryptolaemus montrouzieri TaxID=559131 RepID=A0ABD2NPL2_9CUCU